MYTVRDISQIVRRLFTPVDSFQGGDEIKMYKQQFKPFDIAKLLTIYGAALAFSLILGQLH
ncbi:MAG: hypothetical protein QNJ17_12040 [Desulfocapsaceae bacterium]|nr:hypothetical protein [Desulfocapsaceae bacterium]